MINRYASLRQGLIGAWCPSLCASGFRLIDRSGYGNHGTLTNMDPGTDWVGSGGKLALDFDGTDDKVNLSSAINLSSTGFSISFWAIQFGSSAAGMPLGDSNATNSYIWFRSGNYLRVNFPVGAVDFATITTFTSYAHYVVTGNQNSASLSTITVFVNSANINSASTTNSTLTCNTLGNGYSGGGFPFPGQIDDVRVYNRTLTPSEIRLLYTGGRGVGLLPERVKHRRKTTAATSNRRRRIICGANC